LHNNLAQQPCATNLQNNLAQLCTTNLHNNPAQQTHRTTLHNNRAQQPCTAQIFFISLILTFFTPQHLLLPRSNEDEIDGSPFFLLTNDFLGSRLPKKRCFSFTVVC
jgi:hypothetical protein